MEWVTKSWQLSRQNNTKNNLCLEILLDSGLFSSPLPSNQKGQEFFAYIHYKPGKDKPFRIKTRNLQWRSNFAVTAGKALAFFHENIIVPKDASVLPCGNVLSTADRPKDLTLRKALFMSSPAGNTIADIPVSNEDKELAGLLLRYLNNELDFYKSSPVVLHNDAHRRHLLSDRSGHVQSLVFYGNLGVGPAEMDFAQLTYWPGLQNDILDSYENCTGRKLDYKLIFLTRAVWSLYYSYVLRHPIYNAVSMAEHHRNSLLEAISWLSTRGEEQDFAKFIKPARPANFQRHLSRYCSTQNVLTQR